MPRKPGLRRRAFFLSLGLLAVFLLFEGLASVLCVVLEITPAPQLPPAPEQGHTRYDPDLGWSSQPNAKVRGVYGRGTGIKINSQGLRSDREVSSQRPTGRLRAICSGDSFTFGHGVNNEDAWCQVLEQLEPRLEAVNMGQGAYGVDQAYLWFMRDGVKFEHDLHVFAFINDDIHRMRRDVFNGYGKPVLRAQSERLAVENVPAPVRRPDAPALALLVNRIRQLRSVQLFRALHTRLRPNADPNAILDEAETRKVLGLVLAALRETSRKQGSTFVLVHLPTRYELDGEGDWPSWRSFLKEETERLGVAFFDLQEEVERLPEEDRYAMFLGLRGGHYSVRGNRLIAGFLHERLAALPEFAAKLGTLGQSY